MLFRSILAHGASALNEDFQDSIMPDAGDDGHLEAGGALCAQWLADNRKKALLSPCGVGTIDQALLAVLKTRHQALRLFGLGRSVFIGDEVCQGVVDSEPGFYGDVWVKWVGNDLKCLEKKQKRLKKTEKNNLREI